VVSATVTGASDSPSADLLAAWLANALRCPVARTRSRAGSGVVSVRLERRSGNIDLVRPEGDSATLLQPGQPDRTIALPHRSDAECLADELRRLDPDEVYAEVMTKGMRLLGSGKGKTASEAVADGEAPSPVEAKRTAARIKRAARAQSRASMVEAAPEPPETSDRATVKKAAARKLADATGQSGPETVDEAGRTVSEPGS
jgi:hypothetical protein